MPNGFEGPFQFPSVKKPRAAPAGFFMGRIHALLTLGLCRLGPRLRDPDRLRPRNLSLCHAELLRASRRFPRRLRRARPAPARGRGRLEKSPGRPSRARLFRLLCPGFQDGFADFLYAGGNGEPPVVPPWYYRRTVYETPEGLASTEEWFAGYRHGAGRRSKRPARTGGSPRVAPRSGTLDHRPQRGIGESFASGNPPMPAGEVVPSLPQPRPVPPEDNP